MLIINDISSADFKLLLAKSFTSVATTANPLPASPALAASMDAFKDNRFVWFAKSLIILIMPTIFDDIFFSSSISFITDATETSMSFIASIVLLTASFPLFITFNMFMAVSEEAVELACISSTIAE